MLRYGGGPAHARWLAADSAERSASRDRACAWRSLEIDGETFPAQFWVICRSLNATWYQSLTPDPKICLNHLRMHGNFFGRSRGERLPEVEHGNARAKPHYKRHIMLDQKNRNTGFHQRTKETFHFLDLPLPHSGNGFIEK